MDDEEDHEDVDEEDDAVEYVWFAFLLLTLLFMLFEILLKWPLWFDDVVCDNEVLCICFDKLKSDVNLAEIDFIKQIKSNSKNKSKGEFHSYVFWFCTFNMIYYRKKWKNKGST